MRHIQCWWNCWWCQGTKQQSAADVETTDELHDCHTSLHPAEMWSSRAGTLAMTGKPQHHQHLTAYTSVVCYYLHIIWQSGTDVFSQTPARKVLGRWIQGQCIDWRACYLLHICYHSFTHAQSARINTWLQTAITPESATNETSWICKYGKEPTKQLKLVRDWSTFTAAAYSSDTTVCPV